MATKSAARVAQKPVDLERPEPKSAFPKTLGECIDSLYLARAKRLALDKEVEEMKKVETALREHIKHNFAEEDLDGARGKIATATLTTLYQPTATDWAVVFEYIRKNRAFDLLQKRLSATACRARWDNNKNIPGVEKIPVTDLSVTKI